MAQYTKETLQQAWCGGSRHTLARRRGRGVPQRGRGATEPGPAPKFIRPRFATEGGPASECPRSRSGDKDGRASTFRWRRICRRGVRLERGGGQSRADRPPWAMGAPPCWGPMGGPGPRSLVSGERKPGVPPPTLVSPYGGLGRGPCLALPSALCACRKDLSAGDSPLPAVAAKRRRAGLRVTAQGSPLPLHFPGRTPTETW